jgi:hypothetical protein
MNSSFQRFSHSVAYWVTSAVGLSSLKPFSITSGATLPVGSITSSGSSRPSRTSAVIVSIWEKSTGVAIAARLRIGISGWRAAESRLSTPPKQ